MATRDAFSEEDLARLRGFPEITRAELIRYFTLTEPDDTFVRQFRGPANILGAAVQLCTLLWMGFVPDDVHGAPAVAVSRLAERVHVPCGRVVRLRGAGADPHRSPARDPALQRLALHRHSGLEGTRRVPVRPGDGARFPKLLFGQACEYLSSGRVMRPGVVHLLEHVATARTRARAETWTRVAHVLDPQRRIELDTLLEVDPELGRTPLNWLGVGPTNASPAAVKTEVDKLGFLRRLDAHTLDLSTLPTERRRFLAGVGRRLTGQALSRREPERRYPILLTLLAQSAVDVLDEVLLLFDQAISGRESAAQAKLTELLAERARRGEDRQRVLDEILQVVMDPDIGDETVGLLLYANGSGWSGCGRRGLHASSRCHAITGTWRCWTHR